jgi:hypothetical protein
MTAPKRRGAAWTEEQGTSDEGRRRVKAPRRCKESGARGNGEAGGAPEVQRKRAPGTRYGAGMAIRLTRRAHDATNSLQAVRPASAQGVARGAGTGDGHAVARLGARSKVCARTAGPHACTLPVLTLKSTADATARTATSATARNRTRNRTGGRPAAQRFREGAPRSSVPGFPSSAASRVKIANIDVRRASPACNAVSIPERTRSSRAGKLITDSVHRVFPSDDRGHENAPDPCATA